MNAASPLCFVPLQSVRVPLLLLDEKMRAGRCGTIDMVSLMIFHATLQSLSHVLSCCSELLIRLDILLDERKHRAEASRGTIKALLYVSRVTNNNHVHQSPLESPRTCPWTLCALLGVF